MITSARGTQDQQSEPKNSTLAKINEKLQEAQSDIISMQAELRMAMFDAISAEDVRAIVAKQIEKAKGGDESAAKFVLSQVLGNNTPVKITQNNMITDVATAARLSKQ